MATFRLWAKKRIGSGKNALPEGTFIQVLKNSTTLPSFVEIKEAVKNQLGIELISTVSINDFKWEKL